MKKNILKRMSSFVLSCSLLLNMMGCSAIKKNKGFDTKESMESTENRDETQSTRPAVTEEYIDLLDQVNIDYENEQYYPSSQELTEIIQNSRISGNCQFQFSDNLNVEIDKLVTSIEENSQTFIKNNPQYYYNISEYQTDDEWLRYTSSKTTNDILKFCLQRIFENATNDIEEDFCYLQRLKFVFSNEESKPMGTLYDDEHLIVIYYPEIISDYKRNIMYQENSFDLEIDFYNYLTVVIEHELNHARQQICEHRKTSTTNQDISYCEPYITTLIESSAESSLYNQLIDEQADFKNNNSYAYPYYRANEVLLFLLALPNGEINEYYNAIYDTDSSRLYDFFNLETQEDIQLFYKILYAIDSSDLRTDLMSKVFPDRNKITIGELTDMVGKNYKVDLYKLALKNLMIYTNNNHNFSLEENINLFIIISNYIVYDIGDYELTDNGNYEYLYDSELVKGIKDLEEIYIDFLCGYYQISKDEIEEIKNNNFVETVAAITTGEDPKEKENIDKAEKFLERFPILKNISFANPISVNSYKIFAEDTKESYDIQHKLILKK